MRLSDTCPQPLIALVLWRDLRGRGVELPEPRTFHPTHTPPRAHGPSDARHLYRRLPAAVLQFGGTPYQAMDGAGAPAIVSGTDEKPPLAPVVASSTGDYSGSSGNYGGSSGNYQSV